MVEAFSCFQIVFPFVSRTHGDPAPAVIGKKVRSLMLARCLNSEKRTIVPLDNTDRTTDQLNNFVRYVGKFLQRWLPKV